MGNSMRLWLVTASFPRKLSHERSPAHAGKGKLDELCLAIAAETRDEALHIARCGRIHWSSAEWCVEPCHGPVNS